MTEIRLYDTKTRGKRVLAPSDPGRVTMYVCGPTVYGRAHIGNFRPEVVFDVLARLLRHTYGPDAVVHARNITDIDDKIMNAAAASGRGIEAVANEAADWYFDDARTLGVETLPLAPRATEHLATMIAMMQGLIAAGHAYAADGHVLFDTLSDADYGTLSRRPMDELIAGARVEVAPYKKHPGDFVLWKPSADDQPGWPSPWGRGRPGWHTECTAMIRSTLGQTIDIHGGGQDLIFPHHENEAAQGRCIHHGAPLANIWMHNGFLNFDDDKMSKSLGNIVTVPSLIAAGHKGETIRLALLMAHYRQPLEWTESLLAQAKATLDRWYRVLREAPAIAPRIDDVFVAALSNDLNTPAAMARLSELASAGDAGALAGSARLIGLLAEDTAAWFGRDDGANVDARIAARAAAKEARNWAEADRIRDALKAEGILLEDRPDGTTDWRRA